MAPTTPTRPCWAEISKAALESNFRFLARLAAPHAEILAVLKTDAYGHSIDICAPAVVRAGAEWIGVNSVDEGVAVRAFAPAAHVVVIGGAFPGQGAAVVAHKLTAVAWEPWQLDELERAARAAGAPSDSVLVHIEIDTGMNRQGVTLEFLAPLLAHFAPGSPLKLSGVMTHLYASDESDHAATDSQLDRLNQALSRIADAGHYAEWLSVGSSAAVLKGDAPRIAALAARHGMRALMRPGLALYGIAPRVEPDEPASVAAARAALQPVLTWKSQVVSVFSIPAGATVGYNGTFVATEPMRLALIAMGYGDGLFRSLGNRFSLLVRGERAPLVGRVSMDQCVLDVTEIPDVSVGDEVVVLGAQGSDTISAYDHADAAGTIPWEVFTRIAPRVRRIAV